MCACWAASWRMPAVALPVEAPKQRYNFAPAGSALEKRPPAGSWFITTSCKSTKSTLCGNRLPGPQMARPGKAATVRLGSSQSARPASRAGLDDASQLRPRTTTPGAGTLFGLDGCSRPSSRAEPRLGSHASRQASRPVSREAGMGAGPSGRGAHRAAGGHPHGEHADARGTPQRSHRHLRAAHRLHLDTEDDSSSSSSSDFSRLEIAALDTSLAEEMQAEPQQGTVLRYATFCCRLCVCVQQQARYASKR